MWTTKFFSTVEVDDFPQSPQLPLARSGATTGMRRRRWETYCDLYIERIETRACGEHARNIERVLRRFTRYSRCGDLYVDQIGVEHVDRFIALRRADTWRGQPLAPRTVNNEINILNAAFAMAGPPGPDKRSRRNYGLTDHPPFGDLLDEDEVEPVCVDEPQIAAFLRALRGCRTPHHTVCDPALFWDCVLLLLFSTALRRTGLLAIPRPDPVTFRSRGELLLPARHSKVRRDQRFVLDRAIVERLGDLPTRPGEPLLPWKRQNGRPMSAAYFDQVIRVAQRNAGISEHNRIRPKDLRSTVATIVSDEFGDAVARKRLGHSPTTNTINTNYKNRAPTDRDRAASTHLAGLVLPLVSSSERAG